ncbi:MAG: DUF1845 domain-containing protein [Acidobacteriia bacterium]|nr:DUF1845 domain-containing protein [Terriglobia bacterium]
MADFEGGFSGGFTAAADPRSTLLCITDEGAPTMSNMLPIKVDDGRINNRILAKEAKKDYLARVESARRKIATTFYSPEIKRLFLRCFDSMQLNTHFVSVIARTRIPHEAIEQIEANLRDQVEAMTNEINRAIDGAEALFKGHGITTLAVYDARPLALEVRVISGLGRRYLEMISKVDQLMPILETLAIDDVISQRELDLQKALFKKMIKQVTNSARVFAGGLRRRMNAMDQKQEVAAIASDPPTDDQSDAVIAEAESNATDAARLENSQDAAVPV